MTAKDYRTKYRWQTMIRDVVKLSDTTYRVTVKAENVNDPGAMEVILVGYYLEDTLGNRYTITQVDGLSVVVSDDFELGFGPRVDRQGVIFQSVVDGDSPFLAPAKYENLSISARDKAYGIDLDILWRNKYAYWRLWDQVQYGYLYNGYAVHNSSSLAASNAHIPTEEEWETLSVLYGGDSLSGGHLKEPTTAHWLIGTNDNSSQLTILPAGIRTNLGLFVGLTVSGQFWNTDINGIYYKKVEIGLSDVIFPRGNSPKIMGLSIRLIIDTPNEDYDDNTGIYIGNDGRRYPIIKMSNGVWWMKVNLLETLYRDLTPIPQVIDNNAWIALITGARCSYDNDDNNSVFNYHINTKDLVDFKDSHSVRWIRDRFAVNEVDTYATGPISLENINSLFSSWPSLKAGSESLANYAINFGHLAGALATNSHYTNLIGYRAGYGAINSPYSNLLGTSAGESFTSNSIGANNIIIGTSISLPNETINGINLGGILFGMGAHASLSEISITGSTTGKIGITVVTPTARLHLPATTATASMASLKIDPGTLLSTPESGAIETINAHIYWTNSSGVRLQLDNQDASISLTTTGTSGAATLIAGVLNIPVYGGSGGGINLSDLYGDSPIIYTNTTGHFSHSTADGALHVPSTSTTNNGKVLMAGATAGSIGWTLLTTTNIAEGTNLYYTDARVTANSTVAANTAARHNILTIGTANGLSLPTSPSQVLSLALATTSNPGALSATDWNTFNNKLNAYPILVSIAGLSPVATGLIKLTAGTASLDTSAYLTTNQAISLTDEATGSGTTSITVTLTNSAVIGKVLTGFISTSGIITGSDTILSAFQKLSWDKHNPVTLGTANGLSLSGQILSLALASASTIGALSASDWQIFNSKGTGTVTNVSALTLGTTGTDVSSTVATGTTTPVITLQLPTASATNRGLLSAANWTTFNNKGTVSSVGLTMPTGFTVTGSPVTGSGTLAVTLTAGYYLPTTTDQTTWNAKGTGTVTSVAALTLGTTGTDVSSTVATGTTTPVITLNLPTSSATNRGLLSAADWITFNSKGAPYALPTASSTVLGGVKVGTNLSIASGVLSSSLTSANEIGSYSNYYPLFSSDIGGSPLNTVYTSSPNYTYNPANGTLSLSGAISGRWIYATESLLFNSASLSKIGLGASSNYGTAGQVLTSGGSAGVLTWTTVSGGSSYTFNNGLTLTGSVATLGGTLLNSTTIGATSYTLNVTGTTAPFIATASSGGGVAIEGIATLGTGVWGSSTSSTGIYGTSSSGVGGYFISASNYALQAVSTSSIAAKLWINNSVGNTSLPIIDIIRQTSGAVGDGIGGQIQFSAQTSTSILPSSILESVWTTSANATRTSKFTLYGINSSVTQANLTSYGSGQIQFNKYGLGSFTGTPTKYLAVDSSGYIIETAGSMTWPTGAGITLSNGGTSTWGTTVPIGTAGQVLTVNSGATGYLWTTVSSGSSYTFNNGLTLATGVVKLGGSLLGNTTITSPTYTLTVAATSATALAATSSSGYGIYATSSTNYAGRFEVNGSTQPAICVNNAVSGTAALFYTGGTNDSSVTNIIKIYKTSTGTAVNGIGAAIEFSILDSSGAVSPSNYITSKLTSVTGLSRLSEISFSGYGTLNSVWGLRTILTAKGSGQVVLNNYGSGLFTGTVSKYLAVDSTGNIIEVAGTSGGSMTWPTLPSSATAGLAYYAGSSAWGTTLSIGNYLTTSGSSLELNVAGSFNSVAYGAIPYITDTSGIVIDGNNFYYDQYYSKLSVKSINLLTGSGTLNEGCINAAGIITAGRLTITTAAPTSSTSSGVVGEIRSDSSYIYICYSASAWKRAALSTF